MGVESKEQHEKREMLSKAKEKGLKFSVDRGDKDGDIEIISCDRRVFENDKNGRLIFRKEERFNVLWTLMMTALGAGVPGVMFTEDNLKIKIAAALIFLLFQTGAVVSFNAGRPDQRVFDKNRKCYRIRRANHLITRIFRKTWIDVCSLGRVSKVELSSFQAKRWVSRTLGSGENKYRVQELVTYENFRVNLKTINGKAVTIYDWYEMDEAVEAGQRVADYLGIPFALA